ncbi:MAG: lytic murein transglycosylase [Acidocella sp.]|nr:lytic murein transglycosylase [Acidocella sp.]
MDRRVFLATGVAAAMLPVAARADDFTNYVARLQARAAAAGIPQDIIAQTTGTLVPNADVLRLDKHQPEFTETWATYSSHVLNQTRVAAGQAKAAEASNLLAAVTSRFGVASGVLLGIWGIETNYGKTQGDFGVIDALVTLAWDRESSYFAGEAIAAMKIIAGGQAPADKLIGSYAGAMGQPQFMPSVYLSTAVAFSGDGRPDIWSSDADTLASMANYLAKDGWRPDEPSSESVLVPSNIDPAMTGRQNQRTIGYWTSRGVQRLPGAPLMSNETPAALLMPDGADGQAFLVFRNFSVIRRYNPSDFYALAVGALGRMALS